MTLVLLASALFFVASCSLFDASESITALDDIPSSMHAGELAMWQARLHENPYDIASHNALARHALRARDLDGALHHNRIALTVDPSDPEARVFAANLAASAGLNDRAIAILRAVVGKHPENGMAWALLGLILLQEGEASTAVDALERADRLLVDPSVRVGLETARQLAQMELPAARQP